MHSGDEGRDTLSRNHINALTADLVVVLPGGSGTLSELELAQSTICTALTR
jgi:predicted Rossmann-fold nucleotide-binding protein